MGGRRAGGLVGVEALRRVVVDVCFFTCDGGMRCFVGVAEVRRRGSGDGLGRAGIHARRALIRSLRYSHLGKNENFYWVANNIKTTLNKVRTLTRTGLVQHYSILRSSLKHKRFNLQLKTSTPHQPHRRQDQTRRIPQPRQKEKEKLASSIRS